MVATVRCKDSCLSALSDPIHPTLHWVQHFRLGVKCSVYLDPIGVRAVVVRHAREWLLQLVACLSCCIALREREQGLLLLPCCIPVQAYSITLPCTAAHQVKQPSSSMAQRQATAHHAVAAQQGAAQQIHLCKPCMWETTQRDCAKCWVCSEPAGLAFGEHKRDDFPLGDKPELVSLPFRYQPQCCHSKCPC